MLYCAMTLGLEKIKGLSAILAFAKPDAEMIYPVKNIHIQERTDSSKCTVKSIASDTITGSKIIIKDIIKAPFFII